MTPTPDFTWLFLKMLAGLVLVLGLAFFLLRVVIPRTRFGRLRRGPAGWVHVVDRYALDAHHYLALVKISGRYFVLGMAESSTNLIHELTREEGEKIENS